MKQVIFCKYCGQKFLAERSTARFCPDKPCRQRWKRNSSNNGLNKHALDMREASILIACVYAELFDTDHDPDMIVSLLERIGVIQYDLNRMLAYIGTVQSEQANTWYQCGNCGQRTFGKVENCDFCGESEFFPISV